MTRETLTFATPRPKRWCAPTGSMLGLGSLRVEVLGELAQGESGSQPSPDHLIAQTMPRDLDTRAVTCWTEIPCAGIDVADSEPGGASALVERAVSEVIRMRHGQGAEA